MIVKPEHVTLMMISVAAGAGVFALLRFLKSYIPATPEVGTPAPVILPSLTSRLLELTRLFNVLFDLVGSRTIMIGKLIIVDNENGISVRVQDSRLPSPNMEIALYTRASGVMEFFIADTTNEIQEVIIDWVRSQVESEITRRKSEVVNALSIIASIKDEAPEQTPNTME